MEINLTLTLDEVNACLGALSKLPYEQVSVVIKNIQDQAIPQYKAFELSQQQATE